MTGEWRIVNDGIENIDEESVYFTCSMSPFDGRALNIFVFEGPPCFSIAISIPAWSLIIDHCSLHP